MKWSERASEWWIQWDEKHRSSSSRHQHPYHYHHQRNSIIGIHGAAMIIRWTVQWPQESTSEKRERENKTESEQKKERSDNVWVIEWVRWRTSIIIITSSASLSSSFLSASELLIDDDDKNDDDDVIDDVDNADGGRESATIEGPCFHLRALVCYLVNSLFSEEGVHHLSFQ